MVGGNGRDFIVGGAGNDLLIGGNQRLRIQCRLRLGHPPGISRATEKGRSMIGLFRSLTPSVHLDPVAVSIQNRFADTLHFQQFVN
ncbi:hypothetical protein [Pseudomonas baetica]|uniref:hypothetical protein n=1 Tax=Pseudomonas baetica TaxID=674054 RepID=UPI003D6631CC